MPVVAGLVTLLLLDRAWLPIHLIAVLGTLVRGHYRAHAALADPDRGRHGPIRAARGLARNNVCDHVAGQLRGPLGALLLPDQAPHALARVRGAPPPDCLIGDSERRRDRPGRGDLKLDQLHRWLNRLDASSPGPHAKTTSPRTYTCPPRAPSVTSPATSPTCTARAGSTGSGAWRVMRPIIPTHPTTHTT